METLEQKRQSDEKYCFGCGKVIHSSAGSCPHCGATTAAAAGSVLVSPVTACAAKVPSQIIGNAVHCRQCGQAIAETAPLCPGCGAPTDNAISATGNTKSHVVAGVLALIFGWFGVHKFYCGRIGLGFLYLIFFWTFIPTVIALIEGIIYLTVKDDQTFTRKYCST